MRDQRLLEEHLAKAKEAQALADSFPPGTYYRTCWQAIAEGYRALAETERPTAAPSSDGPSHSVA